MRKTGNGVKGRARSAGGYKDHIRPFAKRVIAKAERKAAKMEAAKE